MGRNRKEDIVKGYEFLNEKDWERLYNEVRKEVLSDILRKKYVEIILRDGDGELDKDFRKVIIDDLK